MTPHLTDRGRWLLALSAAFLVYAVAARNLAVLVTAELVIATVVGAYLVAITRMWALESGGLRAAVVRAERRGELHRGETRTFELRLSNLSSVSFGRAVLEWRRSSGVRMADTVRVAALHGRTRVDIPIRIEAARAGRWTLHGLYGAVEDTFGLVRVATYLPVEEHIKVWPARRAAARARLPASRKRALLPHGGNLADRAGHGFELRELRDYTAGDSVRSVDWKATARRRALTVRDLEDEVVNDLVLAVDVSSTMRGGQDGSLLEHALELGQDLVHAASLRGDRIGVVSFDDRVIGRLGQGAGAAHYRRVLEHLVALPNLAGEGATEHNDADITMAVVQYALVHERLDFRRPGHRQDKLDAFAPLAELVDVPLLARWVEDRLAVEAGPLEAELAAAGLAADPPSPIRRFARVRGIELPYRAESRLGRKASGAIAAVEASVLGVRGGGVLIVVSDLSGVFEPEALDKVLALAATRRVRVVFALPFAPAYVDRLEGELEGLVHDLFTDDARARRDRLAEHLTRRGAQVVQCGPETSAAHVLAVAAVGMRRR